MAIDTSMYGQKPAVQFNPLQAMTSGVNIANGLQQNRLLQQNVQTQQMDIDARQGIRDAQMNSTNPDGTTDSNKFNLLVGSDPRTASQAGILAQQQIGLNAPTQYYDPASKGMRNAPAQNMRGIMTGGQQLSDLHDHTDDMISTVQNLIAKPDLTQKDVINSTTDLMSRGRITPQQAAMEISQAPTDPAQMKRWLQGILATNLQNKQTLNQISAQQPQPADQSITQNDVPPLANQAPSAPSQQQQTPPAIPSVAAGPTMTDAANIPANEASGQKAKTDTVTAGTAAIPLIDTAKTVQKILDSGAKTGAYTPAFTAAKAKLASVFGDNVMPENATDATKIQLLGKGLSRMLQQQGFSDAATDKARGVLESANPGIDKTTQAVRTLAQYVQGNAEMEKGVYNGMNKTLGANPTGSDVNKYMAQVNSAKDPAIFRYLIMNPTDRKQFMAENFKTDADKQAFLDKADQLKKLGVLDSVGK